MQWIIHIVGSICNEHYCTTWITITSVLLPVKSHVNQRRKRIQHVTHIDAVSAVVLHHRYLVEYQWLHLRMIRLVRGGSDEMMTRAVLQLALPSLCQMDGPRANRKALK